MWERVRNLVEGLDGGGTGFGRIRVANKDAEGTPTAVKKPYQISKADAKASAAVEQFTKANGQFLLPLVELIADARLAVDSVIDHVGRRIIETILDLSAQEVAGARTPGK